MNGPSTGRSQAVSSSLNSASVHIYPRTPKTPRVEHSDEDEDEGVELSLLGESAGNGTHRNAEDVDSPEVLKRPISAKDQRSMVLLCFLYLMQGVPLGLALGSIPFLLKEHLSYSQLATFALSSYPYSLKLLWSPIVDSIFFKSIGRRKSWIIPMQFLVGSLMLYLSFNVQTFLDDPGSHVTEFTITFTLLVALSATQDIAVDGWALTLLSKEALPYASTCHTLGLNTGFFSSFTIFLAFNSKAFAAKWGFPQLTLGAYLRFWSIACYSITIWLILFKTEDKEIVTKKVSIKGVYKTIWSICQLKQIQLLIIMHLFSKVAFAAGEATSLKMLEKGLKREDLAIIVLIDFPFQILGGWLAAKWSRGEYPLRPWMYAFWPKLFLEFACVLTVFWFPPQPLTMAFLAYITIQTVMGSFAGIVQFVGISAFHVRISDPLIGGTYMTLLATFSNMGGTWPKWFVLRGIDVFTVATCEVPNTGLHAAVTSFECVSNHGKKACKDLKGTCIIEQDGYYVVSAICFTFGIIFMLAYAIPTARKLQALPISAWRVKLN